MMTMPGNTMIETSWARLFVLATVGLASIFPARGNWQVDGLNGGILARGQLVSSPCILSPESAEQEISLGQNALWALEPPGSVSLPVTVQFVLEDCPTGPSWLSTPQIMAGKQWLSTQPGIRLTLTGESDSMDERYFRIHGSASGVALRLEDERGEWLQPSVSSHPLPLNPGRNVIPLKAQLWRTSAPLHAGEVYAAVNVNMEYE